MDEDLIGEMRLMLAENRDDYAGLPAWWHLFVERPAESIEILSRLFDEYDDGADVGEQIRTLIAVRNCAYKYVSLQRTEALASMDAAAQYKHDANNYPPTSTRVLRLAMLGIAQKPARAARCEQLVRDYPQAAQELLAYFVREQSHDEFFTTSHGVHRDTRPTITILRSMIARTRGAALLDEMGGV